MPERSADNSTVNTSRKVSIRLRKLGLLLALPLLLTAGVLLPLGMADGTSAARGVAAQLARRVLESSDFACRQDPLAQVLALHLRVDSLYLKNIGRLQDEHAAQGQTPQPLPAEPREHYYFDAYVQAYTLFGIPTRLYALSGDEENIQVWCKGRPD